MYATVTRLYEFYLEHLFLVSLNCSLKDTSTEKEMICETVKKVRFTT